MIMPVLIEEESATTALPETADSAAESAADSTQGAAWTRLVDKIQAGDPEGMEELYRHFSKGVRYFLCRQLGVQELDDKVHDTFLIVVNAIRRGELREPERLMGFVRTVVRRQVAASIDQAVHRRREQVELDNNLTLEDDDRNPEERAMTEQKVTLMEDVLRSISRRDREILTRFYLHEQSQEQICIEMRLTETQFRLLKSRAKARFGEIGKRKLMRKAPAIVLLRRSARA